MIKRVFFSLLMPIFLFGDLIKPSDLSFEVGRTKVGISWKDNSDSESGYKIFRDGKLIALLKSDLNNDYMWYEDYGLLPGHSYTYTIKATDEKFLVVENFDDVKRSLLEQIISIFEHGQNEFRYGYAKFIQDYKDRGATLGRIFVSFVTVDDFRDSDSYEVIKRLDSSYDLFNLANDALSGNATLSFIDLEALNNLNIEDEIEEDPKIDRSQLDNIMIAWSDLASDNRFQKAQDEVFYNEVHIPAQSKILHSFDGYKISPFTYLCIVDSYVVRGVGDEEFVEDNGTKGIAFGGDSLIDESFKRVESVKSLDDEILWLESFFALRESNGRSGDIESRRYRIKKLKEILTDAKSDHSLLFFEHIEDEFDSEEERLDRNYHTTF